VLNARRTSSRHRKLVLGGAAGGLFLAFAGTAHAREPSIWYRAGEGCPDGASFLARLSQRGVSARLAAVGDQIDFVVTLGSSGERSAGRLERQTSTGTIALRQVEDARCEAVAEVLAFTLALTQDPTATGYPAANSAPEAGSSPAPAPTAAEVPVTAKAAAVASDPPQSAPPPAPAERGARFALGAELSAWDLFEGPWLLAAGPFGELEAPRSFALPRASVRAVVRGGLRADGNAAAGVWLAAGRLEGCPTALVLGRVDLRPCGALDLGLVGATAAGRSDTAGWLSAAAHARLTLDLGPFAVEAQAGAIFPLTRYEVTAGDSATTLEKTQSAGFAGGIGAKLPLE
jgi:hypothetical protein